MMNKQDENSFLNEIHYYSRLYFEYRQKANDTTLTPYTREYLRDFAQYCKENTYYYAKKLTELKGEDENESL